MYWYCKPSIVKVPTFQHCGLKSKKLWTVCWITLPGLCLFHPELSCMMNPTGQKNSKKRVVHCVKDVFLNTKIQPQMNQSRSKPYNYNHCCSWQLLNHHQQKPLKSMCVRCPRPSGGECGVRKEPAPCEKDRIQITGSQLSLLLLRWAQDKPVRPNETPSSRRTGSSSDRSCEWAGSRTNQSGKYRQTGSFQKYTIPYFSVSFFSRINQNIWKC